MHFTRHCEIQRKAAEPTDSELLQPFQEPLSFIETNAKLGKYILEHMPASVEYLNAFILRLRMQPIACKVMQFIDRVLTAGPQVRRH
jgi:hypothetical protein